VGAQPRLRNTRGGRRQGHRRHEHDDTYELDYPYESEQRLQLQEAGYEPYEQLQVENEQLVEMLERSTAALQQLQQQQSQQQSPQQQSPQGRETDEPRGRQSQRRQPPPRRSQQPRLQQVRDAPTPQATPQPKHQTRALSAPVQIEASAPVQIEAPALAPEPEPEPEPQAMADLPPRDAESPSPRGAAV